VTEFIGFLDLLHLIRPLKYKQAFAYYHSLNMSTEFSSIRLLDKNRLSPMSANINSGNENPIKIRISFPYKVTKEPQNCSENF
jgi:hypothetical protein